MSDEIQRWRTASASGGMIADTEGAWVAWEACQAVVINQGRGHRIEEDALRARIATLEVDLREAERARLDKDIEYSLKS